MTHVWLNDEAVKLVSFDVFDTVIARRCGAPATIFRITGEKLVQRNLLAIAPPVFQSMRVQAEKRAHRHRRNREITLAEIYAELNSFWRLPQAVVDQMMACELETEAENLYVIPGALELVQTVRDAGRRLVFTSDMYLPADFLRDVLAKLGLIQENETLYVSSHWGVSKADGGLYRILLEQEKLRPSQVVHIGDSRVVDYEKARKQGIMAVHSDRGTLNRYEVRLAEAEERISDRIPLMSGISRMARIEWDGLGGQRVAARLGSSVAGPLLTQYAAWVLQTAHSRGVKRLFFLARDGEALMRLCEILAPAIGAHELELRYLYGSRQTWYPAALGKFDDAAAEFFARSVALNADSWEKCVEYLGLNASNPLLTPLAARWSDWTPTVEAKQKLFLDVTQDPNCRPVIKKWLADKVELASRYLREAGLVGPERCGLVDVGWTGSWTDILSDLVTAQGGTAPEVYFLGRRAAKTTSRSPTFTFLFDHQSGTGLDQIPDYFHIVVEFFLTANHGRTAGFSEKDGRLEPVLAAADLQGFTPEQWTAFRKALLRFAELYALQISPAPMLADLRRQLVELISLLWERPSMGEAALLGCHTVGLTPSGSGDRQLARAYRFRDLFQLVFRMRLPGYPPFWWHEGAQAMTPSSLRVAMGTLWQLRELIRAVVHEGAGIRLRRLTDLGLASARKIWWQCQPPAEPASLFGAATVQRRATQAGFSPMNVSGHERSPATALQPK